jgi:broad specificity phosphatase PhoE
VGSIYLVRHAQASFAAADYDLLSELGERQAQVLGAALKSRLGRVTTVVCGGMKRHRQTAEICRAAMDLRAELAIDEGWNEYDHDGVVAAFEPRFGDRAALLAELARHDDPQRVFQAMFEQAVARWVRGEHAGDYREAWSAFRARVLEALGRVGRSLGKAETALVFTSGGPISAVCGALLHVPEDKQLLLGWTLANGGITKLIGRGEVFHLSTLNEHAHFDRALTTYR